MAQCPDIKIVVGQYFYHLSFDERGAVIVYMDLKPSWRERKIPLKERLIKAGEKMRSEWYDVREAKTYLNNE